MESKTGKSEEYLLVIEDDNNLRELIIKALSRAGLKAAGAATAAGALERISSDPPLALLIDQSLPDMSGKEIITALAAHSTHIPFIVMTGQGDERLAVEMMKLGAADYLTKDSDFLDMLPAAATRLMDTIKTKRELDKARKEIEKGEANFADIFHTVSEGICYATNKGKVISVNNALENITGIPKEELIDKNVLVLAKKFLTAKSVLKALPFLTDLLSGSDTRPIEIDFSGKTLEISAKRNNDTNRIISVIRDITERKRAEEELRVSESKFSTIFQTSPVAIALTRMRDNILIDVNKAW